MIKSKEILFYCFITLAVLMASFRISSLNLNGARDAKKRALFFELVKLKGIDISFLQETHTTADIEVEWKREWDGNIVFSHNSNLSAGVAILFAKNFLPVSFDCEEIIKGRLLKVTARYEKSTFTLLNVYAPVSPQERCCFLNKLADTLSGCAQTDFLILGGDFNCTVDDLDRNHLEPNLQSRKFLKRIIATYDLSDVWRSKHGNCRQYSWSHARDNYITLARLDRFYCFNHHLQIFKKCFLSPVGFSDHFLLVGTVFISRVKPKSAYWHFNISLLNDCTFKKCLTFLWEEWRCKKHEHSSLQQWWDLGKVRVKQFCIQYNLNVTREAAQSIKNLETSIVELQELSNSTGDQSHLKAFKDKKAVLADLLGVRAQGALVRSRFRNLVEMDAPSKFFFNLEKKNGQNRIIHCIQSADGIELTQSDDIRKRAVDFYTELYNCQYTEFDQRGELFFDQLPQLSEDNNASLEQPLSLQELQGALMSTANGKAPGIDGLPVDFYKCFWSTIGVDLLEVINDSLAAGKLPLSCRRAVLTLLPKKGDLSEIKNWRPVSLLCADYKILSKALANRLRRVIGNVIHIDQSYCVPGRSLKDNISLIRDYLQISKTLGLNFGLISLDQEKAFDRVEHQYLWETLGAFGFSPVFTNKIKVLYNQIESVLKINGGLTASFAIKRGIRQGCALSGMLYSLAIEPFLSKIRKALSGVKLSVNCVPLHLSAYADDIIVAVNNDGDVEKLMKIIESFENMSSSKVNWAKSSALLSGNWHGRVPKLPDGIFWERHGIKYLGVQLGDDSAEKRNWEGVVEKMEGRLGRWRWLLPRMSYRGRSIIINNLVASSLWHRLAVLEPPAGLLGRLQSIIVDFFWDKLHWVPQSILFLPKEEGGQGIASLASRKAAFRLQFLQSFLYGPQNLPWRQVAGIVFGWVGGLGFGKTLFSLDCSCFNLNVLPPFYLSVLKTWSVMEAGCLEATSSLYWLLREPILKGARLAAAWEEVPNMTGLLKEKEITTVQELLQLAGAQVDNAENVAGRLAVRSTRVVGRRLDGFKKALSSEDRALLTGWFKGDLTPDHSDPFPKICIRPFGKDCEALGPLLDRQEWMSMDSASGKSLYMGCVKALNKEKLKGKTDTPWRDHLRVKAEVKPAWSTLYKAPVTKNIGDLHWRVLHGIIAVNGFVSILNPSVSDKCLFCNLRETIFHCFVDCSRLIPLFQNLRSVVSLFKEKFSKQLFIFGFSYRKNKKKKGKLLNFLFGQAKMAIYLSRRETIDGGQRRDCVSIFKCLVRARIRFEYNYYAKMEDVDTFKGVWDSEGILFSIKDPDITFTDLLL
jgi:exonuclease III